MKNIEVFRAGPVRCPHGPRTGTHRVLRIILQNHKCTAVSNRTGPVALCDHENSTDVKFVRALHFALRARNRTGDKIRTGPVVGCDWGISNQRLRLAVSQQRQQRSVRLSAPSARRLWTAVFDLLNKFTDPQMQFYIEILNHMHKLHL